MNIAFMIPAGCITRHSSGFWLFPVTSNLVGNELYFNTREGFVYYFRLGIVGECVTRCRPSRRLDSLVLKKEAEGDETS
jgi:hypothetical protein